MVSVQHPSWGLQEHKHGVSLLVSPSGALIVRDVKSRCIHVYAPGQWAEAWVEKGFEADN